MEEKKLWFWTWVTTSLFFRLLLIYFPKNLNLGSRPEVATPLTSLRRLAEGYWLKQLSMSPYTGSMYHGSPLLLSILGPLTVKRIEGQPNHLICSLLFVVADFVTAMLIRATGRILQMRYSQSLKALNLVRLLETSGLVPLAALGWVIATHLSLYPAVLIIPVILLLGNGPDAPPRKLFMQRNCTTGDNSSTESHYQCKEVTRQPVLPVLFSWRSFMHFMLWASIWSFYVSVLCGISVQQYGGLWEMLKKRHMIDGLEVLLPDVELSLNIRIYSYRRRSFPKYRCLMVLLCRSFRLFQRFLSDSFPCEYSIHDIAIGHTAESPAMLSCFRVYYNLFHAQILSFSKFSLSSSYKISSFTRFRGTGNANFYFATAMVYACLQILLVVESVGAMLNHDRMLRKQSTTHP
ncbi:hypothetical protein HHK36_027792 [Tetracentron sinense]|uniref:Uncharacterized protein n=1 Tax=Tetracentron sinense TaxID=13715 RepID=A0A834YJT2_TETSI|nr:hypothetical protein HHK36_027792 [Tetracentron sinense]